MSLSSTGQAISPRQKDTKLKGETTVEENNKNNSLNTDKKVEKGTDLPVHKEQGKLTVAGVRPIASSDLQIAETVAISGIRPIGTSSLQVVETMNIMGIRPIGANTFEVVDSINLSGLRPIGSSALVVSDSYSIMGNRPVASNVTDDSDSLMGFLD